MSFNFFDLVGISSAFAADNAASPQQGILSMLPLFVIIILFMYFMVIRPQQKRVKEQKNLLGNLKQDDEVLTSGGLLGRIEKMDADFVVLNISQGVSVHIQKAAIVSCVPKGTIKSI